MRLLLVKLSSLGDVLHTLPALTDAYQAHPDLQVDWVVEAAYAEIPAWHRAVAQVIPVALRHWRKTAWQSWRSGVWRDLRQQLRAKRYDLVLDAQGLLKSAAVARLARGSRAGLNWASAREPLASWSYHRTYSVPWGGHAVPRLRQLFAQALAYPVPTTAPDFGLRLALDPRWGPRPYLVWLHGTAWVSKQWPEPAWVELSRYAAAAGYRVLLPWGDAGEQARAERLAASGIGEVLPQLTLTELASALVGAAGVVGVDTGLTHLAAALGRPGVALYGATNPALTGALGARHRNLSAVFPCAPCLRRSCHQVPAGQVPPCYATLSPVQVWAALQTQMRLAP